IRHLRLRCRRKCLEFGDADASGDAQIGSQCKLQQRCHCRSRVVSAWDLRVDRQRRQRLGPPVLIEPRPLEAGAKSAGPELRRLKAQAGTGSFLDRVFGIGERKHWHETDDAVTDVDVPESSPTLLGVINEIRSERLETQPRWRLFLASLVDQLDAADLTALLDASRDVVAR